MTRTLLDSLYPGELTARLEAGGTNPGTVMRRHMAWAKVRFTPSSPYSPAIPGDSSAVV